MLNVFSMNVRINSQEPADLRNKQFSLVCVKYIIYIISNANY